MTLKTRSSLLPDANVARLLADADQLLSEQQDARAETAYLKALDLAPNLPAAHRGLAIVAHRRRANDEAAERMGKAAALAPESGALRAEYARMLAIAGRGPDALRQFEAAVSLSPANGEAWHYYGLALLAQKEKRAAAAAFRNSLRVQPGRTGTLEQLARLLLELGLPEEARPVWQELTDKEPGQVQHRLGLAQACWEDGDIEAALAAYAATAQRFPESAEVAMAYGLALEDKGDRQGAEGEFTRALRLHPGWAYATGTLLELKKASSEPALVAEAERLINAPETPDASRALLGFGLGKVYESQGEYRAAFEAWQVANRARRGRGGLLDRAALRERGDRQLRTFSREFLEERRSWGAPDGRPVFIVGMPRSGTTLVEQIIAAHPQAFGCGELPDLHRIAVALPDQVGTLLSWPEAATVLTEEAARAAAQRYLRVLERRAGSAPVRVSDKTPTNFNHLGLIALLFPQAHVIWCCRDPRDVCVSIYSENFAARQSYATDLGDLACYHREQERLMAGWQNALPLRIERVAYEDMVADFEPTVRRLLAFLGLPFAPECLAFHQQERAVLTPSRWQVRQPLYTSSVGRWKHYEEWLGPLLDGLGMTRE